TGSFPYEFHHSQAEQTVDAGYHVVRHDAPPPWQALSTPSRKRFDHIEEPEDRESDQQQLPGSVRASEIRDHLTQHLVNDHRAGVSAAEKPFRAARSPHTESEDEDAGYRLPHDRA